MIQMKKPSRETVKRAKLIEKCCRQAVRKAQLQHKALGLPIVVWKNGRVVTIPPEKI
jgi:hypothetical protein